MKRKEFYQLVLPLTDKLYRFAYALLPDSLSAEQLVIDSLNAYLLKEKKNILRREVNLDNKKEAQLARRGYFKGILRHLSDIGLRRSLQLTQQMKFKGVEDFGPYYNLDPKVRFIISLRYEARFTVDEIEEIVQMPRFEVIEKIHNGRFLLLSDLNSGVEL